MVLRFIYHYPFIVIHTEVRKSLAIYVDSPPKRRGRPKKMWMEVIKIDLKMYNSSENLTQNGEPKFM